MKQIIQSLKTGITEVVNVPVPSVSPGKLLVATRCSLISSGTEKMLVRFGKANIFSKAIQQPDKFRAVLDKIKVDGFLPTLETVINKLEQPISMGYCNVGRVIESSSTQHYRVGERIVSNGSHAEIVCVPINLCAKIPDEVSDEEAAFTVVAAVALQGIRLAQPTLGETVVVIGLGLVGLITVQLLLANGCRVLGIDLDPERLKLAKMFGAEVIDPSNGQDPILTANIFSCGRGVDAVIITASTLSNEPIHIAAQISRQRGRIILVGVSGLDLVREDFYKKELTFQVSASYGPGRYDVNYEEKGHDYPPGFVRWTAQRNFEAILDMMRMGKLNVKPLISHHFQIDAAAEAYRLIDSSEKSLGIVIQYPNKEENYERTIPLVFESCKQKHKTDFLNVSFVGAGNYATSKLIPAFKSCNVILNSVSSSGGLSGFNAARKFRFQKVTTDSRQLISDKMTDAVVIATRHDSHSYYILEALSKRKHVFVEKPLCINLEELKAITTTYSGLSLDGEAPILMVGFNRRFSPHVKKIKSLLQEVASPKSIVMTINAGHISHDHWVLDHDLSGGRVIGEVCHFIDLMRFLIGAEIAGWVKTNLDSLTKDTLTITLKFKDGSIGTIHYFSNGSRTYPKETLEVFVDGRVLQLDNYRKLTGYGWPNFKKMNLLKQDKGQISCVSAFVDSILHAKQSPIPFSEIIEVSRTTIEIANH